MKYGRNTSHSYYTLILIGYILQFMDTNILFQYWETTC